MHRGASEGLQQPLHVLQEIIDVFPRLHGVAHTRGQGARGDAGACISAASTERHVANETNTNTANETYTNTDTDSDSGSDSD